MPHEKGDTVRCPLRLSPAEKGRATAARHSGLGLFGIAHHFQDAGLAPDGLLMTS